MLTERRIAALVLLAVVALGVLFARMDPQPADRGGPVAGGP